MISSSLQLPLGIILAAIIAAVAFFARSLNRSGAIAAFILGTVIFGIGGLSWSILLLAFFVSSSLLSRIFKKQKLTVEEKFSKGSRRDAGQVAANGAIAGLIALIFPILGGPSWLWAAFAGALASVNADTWATELGVLNKKSPRLITTGESVEPGTSGGISVTGTMASLGGSALIAILAVIFKPDQFAFSIENNILLFLIVTIAGMTGSLVDSLFGATCQAIYFCGICEKQTERHPLHSCGNPTTLYRGAAWLNNDWVNAFCALTGAVSAGLLSLVLISASSNSPLSNGGTGMTGLSITSPAFSNNQPIPIKFSCIGEDASPEIIITGVPQSTKSLVMIMDDPDAPMGTFTHWVVYNLPPTITTLAENTPEGAISNGGTQGLNSARQNGYMGPCPPSGKPHRYFFRVYATDLIPDLPEGLTSSKLTASIEGHMLASGELMGTFQR
jgi:uncharacterized protein (TIGR00297 family)/Raf kinase inhibitor-like YbhB/YbcL family protein